MVESPHSYIGKGVFIWHKQFRRQHLPSLQESGKSSSRRGIDSKYGCVTGENRPGADESGAVRLMLTRILILGVCLRLYAVKSSLKNQ